MPGTRAFAPSSSLRTACCWVTSSYSTTDTAVPQHMGRVPRGTARFIKQRWFWQRLYLDANMGRRAARRGSSTNYPAHAAGCSVPAGRRRDVLRCYLPHASTFRSTAHHHTTCGCAYISITSNCHRISHKRYRTRHTTTFSRLPGARPGTVRPGCGAGRNRVTRHHRFQSQSL